MTGEPENDVERLFAAALERSPDERSAFLATAAPDGNVRSEVLALLRAHEERGPLDNLVDALGNLRNATTPVPVEQIVERLRRGLGDRYLVERELARGGMAIVCLAHDLKHGRKVALKVLHPTLALSIGSARFLQEIAIAAQLAHPHILPLHDSGEVDGLLFYVMPYVEGESLRDLLRREGRLPLADAIQIARQVADALSYAHSRDVVHRDIKPENILLQAGHAVVTDFGIARAMTVAGGDAVSETGIILGTPAYMSPERALGSRAIDGRADIYSLGCVLHEMLVGEPPFSGEPPDDTLRARLAEPLALPLLSEVPPQVGAVIRRALARSPAERFATGAELAEALDAVLVAGPPERRSRRVRRTAISAGVGLAAIAIAVVATGSRRPTHPAASVIAVLPLASSGGDTALARLGRDLVVTLSANLDGVGEIRMVDALTVLAQAAGPVTLEQGLGLARQLGASSALHGTIVRTGSDVRVDLGLYTTDSAVALARATVTADPTELTALTDSLTWTILGAVWRTRGPPTPSVAGVTTRSLAALRAFLEGERAGLEGRWDAAAEAYARAMRADTTFWLAYWRYSYARWWYLEEVNDSVLAPLYQHRFALPERDRLVLESWWTDTISLALARGREAVTRYPDYWPGWMQYADWLFHAGPVHGYDLAEARAALEHTVQLNPSFLPAWEHLFWVTIGTDTSAAARALDALIRLDLPRTTIAEFGYDVTRAYRLDLHLARSGELDEAVLDSLVVDLATVARRRVGGGTTLLPAQVEVSRRVLAAGPRPEVASVHELLLADALAGRGAWDSALVVAQRYARRPVGGDALYAYRLAVIAAWLGAISPDSALRLRAVPALAVERTGSSAMWWAELGWLDGLLAVARGDREGLGVARARVQRADTVSTGVLDLSLAAFEAELSGARAQGSRTLATLNWDRPDLLVPGYQVHPYVIAVARLAAARSLIALGDTTRARRALRWFDAVWALDGYRPARRVLAALATRERARLAEMQADRDAARRWYIEFLRRYDMPVPSHGHLIAEGRAAIRRLGG